MSNFSGQIPGFPWKPRVTSWQLQAFLGIPLQAFEEAKNFLAFAAFSRLFRGKKAWKRQESQELQAFLGSPGFSGLFLQELLTTTCADEYTFNLLLLN